MIVKRNKEREEDAMMVYTCTYRSKLGDILLAADEVGLMGLWFEGQKMCIRDRASRWGEVFTGESAIWN